MPSENQVCVSESLTEVNCLSRQRPRGYFRGGNHGSWDAGHGMLTMEQMEKHHTRTTDDTFSPLCRAESDRCRGLG
jgi:hypothetical protein